MLSFGFLWALALVSSSYAQKSSYCTSKDGVCYAINVPDSTASKGSGDIYFQISGPINMSWIGLGQGSEMTNANIFMVYSNAAGSNLTLSPRMGVGNMEPVAPSIANVTLLDGSGTSNGRMIANVKCSNCNSWAGGSMSLTDSSSEWIWAYKSGPSISSDSTDAPLALHSKYGTTTFDLQIAAGGDSANPFSNTTVAPSTSTSSASSDEETGQIPSNFVPILIAHAILAPIAFIILFPLGAIGIRALSFKNVVFVHAGWMIFTYVIVLAAMGLGVWIAVTTHQLGTYHAIIGLVVVGSLLLQPVTGLTHHLLYKQKGRPNVATYPHVWWGRAIITLGIINGGFGLQLADNTRGGEIAYGVVAGVMWCLWMAVIIFGFMKNRDNREGETDAALFGADAEKQTSNERMKKFESTRDSPMRQSYSGSDEVFGNRSTKSG